jgi:hypothetical protein
VCTKIHIYQGAYTTGTINPTHKEYGKNYFTLIEQPTDEPITFTHQQVETLVEGLDKLHNYLQAVDWKQHKGVIFIEPVYTQDNKRIRIKCCKHLNYYMTCIQQDYWDEKANRWYHAKKEKKDRAIRFVRLHFTEYKTLHDFLVQYALH